MYDVMSKKAEDFISDEEILDSIAFAQQNKRNREFIDRIIEKAKS